LRNWRPDIGLPEPGEQQVAAVEDVKRQVAMAAVIAVKEAAFPTALQGIVRRIEVEDDPLRCPLV